jgi:RNA polymerase sigma-70 factor, ECF subfamily
VSTTVSPWTDAPDDVLVRAQRGDPEAFRALVDTYHAEMVRLAYVITGDVEIARDAVQAAWIKAWRQLAGLRDPARLRSWLVAIACNEARQAMRARRRRAVREVVMPESEPTRGGPTPDHMDLAGALARLDPEDRALIAMRYLAGLGSDEIARATGRSASAARTRLSRLVARLREDLSDD